LKSVLLIGAGRIAGINELDEYRKKPCTHFGMYLKNKKYNVVGIIDKDLNKAQNFSKIFIFCALSILPK